MRNEHGSAALSATRLRGILLALALLPLAAGAHVGTFDPYNVVPMEPQLVTIVDTNAAPVHCMGIAAENGNTMLALVGFIAPMTACAAYTADNSRCTIIAPISPGIGQAVAAVTALTGPDALLGHEFRHCRDHDFHPAMMPFAESHQD